MLQEFVLAALFNSVRSQANLIVSLLPGTVHRGIGVPEQAFRISTAAEIHTGADAGGDCGGLHSELKVGQTFCDIDQQRIAARVPCRGFQKAWLYCTLSMFTSLL